jgi:hypothetical protein
VVYLHAGNEAPRNASVEGISIAGRGQSIEALDPVMGTVGRELRDARIVAARKAACGRGQGGCGDRSPELMSGSPTPPYAGEQSVASSSRAGRRPDFTTKDAEAPRGDRGQPLHHELPVRRVPQVNLSRAAELIDGTLLGDALLPGGELRGVQRDLRVQRNVFRFFRDQDSGKVLCKEKFHTDYVAGDNVICGLPPVPDAEPKPKPTPKPKPSRN